MNNELLTNLGEKATIFGLGMLVSKKMRPYAKYFVIGGLAMSATPALISLAEQYQSNKSPQIELVEEVKPEENSCEQDESCGKEEEQCCQQEDCECQDGETETVDEDCECPEVEEVHEEEPEA